MHAVDIAETQIAPCHHHSARRITSRFALAAFLTLAAIPLSHAAVCSLDIDGNGKLEATTDGLLMTRYLLGLRGAALVSGALGAGATRTLPADIEAHLATPCAQAGWVGQGTGRLNDTGISFFGDSASTNLSGCPSTLLLLYPSQDCLAGRDAKPAQNSATDGVAGFSFTKIGNNGAPLPASTPLGSGAADWACSHDNTTGLMWEVKTTTGRRRASQTYSWYSSDASSNAGFSGVPNGGVCDDVGQCDTEKFTQQTNLGVGLCGHTDWRVPHVKELEGIAYFGAVIPAIDVFWLPNTVAIAYWSNTPSATLGAWKVDFRNGSAFASPRNNPSAVRLVRSGQ